jgi:hypothetical protein
VEPGFRLDYVFGDNEIARRRLILLADWFTYDSCDH